MTPEHFSRLPVEDRLAMFDLRQACGGPIRNLHDAITGNRWNGPSWSPHYPTPRQQLFLMEQGRESLYGGAAGGGKSDAALMAAAQYLCIPGYNAVIFRQTYGQLAQDGGLIERSLEWWSDVGTYNQGTHRWTFPSGASVTFGALQYEKDKHKHQGAEYHFCYFDELTNFPTDGAYRYLFSRLRKPAQTEGLPACPSCGMSLADVPLRMRAGTNPGGIGGGWVYDRFVAPWRAVVSGEATYTGDRSFIPSRLKDNPYLDYESYVASLSELDPVERARLLDGDWDVRAKGSMLDRLDFEIVDDYPRDAPRARYWDLAATDAMDAADPDWTAGALLARQDGQTWIIDINRFRAGPAEVQKRVRAQAEYDGIAVPVAIEREGGASGKTTAFHYRRTVLDGFVFHDAVKSNSKAQEAGPLSAAAKNGNVFVVRGDWNNDWFDEADVFPQPGFHDDQVDAVAGAFNYLSGKGKPPGGGLKN